MPPPPLRTVNGRLTVLVGIVVVALSYPAWNALQGRDSPPDRILGRFYPDSDIAFLHRTDPSPNTDLPLVSHVQFHDLDKDGRAELIICDIRLHSITAGSLSDGRLNERTLVTGLSAPAHASFADIDGNGSEDLIIADLGDLLPNSGRVGSVRIAFNHDGVYGPPAVICRDVRRVADAQAGDLDGDGDCDIAVAEFGHSLGSVFWLEQTDSHAFLRHELLPGAGSIHVPLADFDKDGDLDIATILSQDEEEVWMLENDGNGHFKRRLLFHDPNFDLGMGGLVRHDMDADGDDDLLLPVGDNLERTFHYPQSFHGCYILENRGGMTFDVRRISDLPGAYAVAPGDLDQDGDADLVLVSMSNDFTDPRSASVISLINDGHLRFSARQIAAQPIQLITCAIGDIDGDGRNDILAGSLHIHPPYSGIERLPIWLRQ